MKVSNIVFCLFRKIPIQSPSSLLLISFSMAKTIFCPAVTFSSSVSVFVVLNIRFNNPFCCLVIPNFCLVCSLWFEEFGLFLLLCLVNHRHSNQFMKHTNILSQKIKILKNVSVAWGFASKRPTPKNDQIDRRIISKEKVPLPVFAPGMHPMEVRDSCAECCLRCPLDCFSILYSGITPHSTVRLAGSTPKTVSPLHHLKL